jgi:hypothetical protein
MARSAMLLAVMLVSLGAFAAGQDLGVLLTSEETCRSNPCFEYANMPAQCCEAEFLYTIAQGVSQGLAMLHNDTSIICSDTCSKVVFGKFRECLLKQHGNETVASILPDDFCGVTCLFDDPELNISERDIYDCGTLEAIPYDCRKNITANTKVGSLFTSAYTNCGYEEDEYMNAASGTALSLVAMVGAGAAALMALLA